MNKLLKTGCILLSGVLIIGNSSGKTGDTVQASSSGINVRYHTAQEIRQYIAENPFEMMASVYDVQPNYTSAPYSAGSLSDETLQNALNALNTVRYIAGIDEVALLDEYNEISQAGALVNAVNDDLSHNPQQPAGMSDELYQMGLEGASSANLGCGYSSLPMDIIFGWMKDATGSNLACLGHRRWCINPSMEYTGFGNVGNYYAMHSFDNWYANTEYYGVAWPAQVMPVQYFDGNFPWSISMGYDVDLSDVEVILTRLSDGKKWSFYENSPDGYFGVNNANYGKTGCIIFRPENIEYNAGDSFAVEISGLDNEVSYTVEFFDINAEDEQYKASDVSDYADFIVHKNDGGENVVDTNSDNRVDVFDVICVRRTLIDN